MPNRANPSEKLVFTGPDKVDSQTVDAKQSEQICATSYSAEGVDMQEREELASDSLPGLFNSDFLPESCGFVPDSPVTRFGEKLESCVADFTKNIAESSQCGASDISKLDPAAHIDSQFMNYTEPEDVKNEEGEGDCIMANSEDCPVTTTTDATSDRPNASDAEGNGQETGTVNGNCVSCVSGQSWQEIISSDEESAVDKDELGPQCKRHKLTAREGGRRHTRSSARERFFFFG